MKRFLSLFAIIALIVSMFSGVAFAAPGAADVYTFTATPAYVGEGLDTTVAIATAVTQNDTALVGDVDTFELGIYNAAGSQQKNADDDYIVATLNATGDASFTDSDIGDLAAGIYYVKLTSDSDGTSEGQNQYIDVDGTPGYLSTADSKVVVATLTVIPNCKVVLDNSENVTYTETFGTKELTGKIIDVTSGALRKVDTTLDFVIDDAAGDNVTDNDGLLNGTEGAAIETVDVKDGIFSITVETNQTGQFFLVGTTNTEVNFDNNNTTTLAYDTVRILNSMELATPETFEFTYPVSGQIVVQGSFTNDDFASEDKAKIEIAYVGTNDKKTALAPALTASFADKSSFGFLFDGSKLVNVGDIGIYVNDILVVKGEVKSDAMEVTATESVVTGLSNQTVTFDFNLSSSDIDSDSADKAVAEDHILRIKEITKGDTTIPGATLVDDDDDANNQFTDVDKQTVEYSFACGSLETGTYVFTLELVDETSTVALTKDVEVEVVNPATYNVIGWDFTETNVGNVVIQFPDDGNGDLHTDAGPTVYNDQIPNFEALDDLTITVDEQLSVTKYINSTTKEYPKYFEITAIGAGIDNKTYANFGDDAVTPDAIGKAMYATFKTTETGTLTLTVKAYFATDVADGVSTDVAYTFTKEVEVKGWNVEITPTEVVVDTENTFTITVTDENGDPVNNADIEFEVGGVVVTSASTNIVGGVYTYEDVTFTTVEKIDVMANKSGASAHEVTITDAIDVVGEEVYNVTSDTPVLLNGIQEKIKVTALDENGDVIYPTFTQYDYDADGNVEATTVLSAGTRSDEDDDGVKEAVELTVTPHKEAIKTVIRATNAGNKEKGEATIEVQLPKVVHTGATKITENFKTAVEFTVVDPRDDSVMDVTVTIVNSSGYVATHTIDTDLDVDSDYVWTAEYTDEVSNLADEGWDKAADDEATIDHDIMMGEVKLGTLEVAKASLTSDPDKIIIGSGTNMTLTYVDAEGNPLEAYSVELNGEEVGETDENGQVVYAASSTNSLSLTFKAATDVTGETVDLKVKSAADVEAPVATYELNGNTAIITITDNVRITKAMVNGEEVDMFFPMPTATHVVSGLTAGENTVTVLAVDINNNYTQTELVITVEATVEPVNFTIGEATEYGVPELKSETTMVPVRFAEDLGATVAWDNATQTVTYQLGETEISMTIGSKTAVVKGENTQLTVAPYLNDAGRTMVPLRMIAQELGFTVNWTSNSAPISIE